MIVSTWSEQAFQTRIRRRAAELGLSVRELLARAGMAPDAFSHPPRTSRRIDTIEKLARVADWSLAEAMGFEGIVNDVLMMALEIMHRGVRDAHLPANLKAKITSDVYDLLMERRQKGLALDDANFIAGIEGLIFRTYILGRPAPASSPPPTKAV